jgi:hypothetical protein
VTLCDAGRGYSLADEIVGDDHDLLVKLGENVSRAARHPRPDGVRVLEDCVDAQDGGLATGRLPQR